VPRNAIVLDVIAVQSIMPSGLAEALRKAPLSDEKVALAWRIAVGSAVDHASTVTLKDGVLHVSVARAEWQREIRRSTSLIRSRLDAFLGNGVVRSLKVSMPRQS
jgi:predicted nucleic acid-binding Zn ribbon protein